MIVAQAHLRAVLGIGDSASTVELAALEDVHRGAENAVKKFLGYDPEQKSHTEYYPRRPQQARNAEYVWDRNSTKAYMRAVRGAGNKMIQLAHIPVRAITSVIEDTDGRFGQQSGAFNTNGITLVAGQDYWIQADEDNLSEDGFLWRTGTWPIEPGTVKVTYVAGYSHLELAGDAGNLTATTTSDQNGQYSNVNVDASGISRAVVLTATWGMNQAMQLRKKVGAGWTPGAQASESGNSYSYSVGQEASMIGGLMSVLPAAAAEMLQPYLHYGILLT